MRIGINLEMLDPEYVLIINPSPHAWKYSVYQFCLEMKKWHLTRGKGFLVITLPYSGVAQFSKRYRLDSLKKDTIKMHLGCLHIDMTKHCRSDPTIKELRVFYSQDYDFGLMEPEYASTRGIFLE